MDIRLGLKNVVFVVFLMSLSTLRAFQPGDVIFNEVHFDSNKPADKGILSAVELLVVADKADLNGLQVTDRPFWNVPKNDQCTLQDLGRGFLGTVRSGTLIVIYNGKGQDDTDGEDFVMTFYARSSLFCNVAPTKSAFDLAPVGRGIHLLHLGAQVDFVKYRASNAEHFAPAHPGKLKWEKGADGHIAIGKIGENMGVRFYGDKPDLNDFPIAWFPYSETHKKDNNLGLPNGRANTRWINALRDKASK